MQITLRLSEEYTQRSSICIVQQVRVSANDLNYNIIIIVIIAISSSIGLIRIPLFVQSPIQQQQQRQQPWHTIKFDGDRMGNS